LSKERPRPVRQGEPSVGAPEGLAGRNDVEKSKTLDPIRVVERHAIGDARPAIVADDRKAREPLRRHHANHVERHHALRVWRVIRLGRRLAACAVPAKIGADDREFFRQGRRDATPHEMRLRKAVQKQQRPAAPRATDEDRRLADVNDRCLKSAEHRTSHARRMVRFGVLFFSPHDMLHL
jgi:hypothetical protein